MKNVFDRRTCMHCVLAIYLQKKRVKIAAMETNNQGKINQRARTHTVCKSRVYLCRVESKLLDECDCTSEGSI